jgi:histidinol-phosphate/aromatic aminotransferase/cobyric acid decarboxylase-like protein
MKKAGRIDETPETRAAGAHASGFRDSLRVRPASTTSRHDLVEVSVIGERSQRRRGFAFRAFDLGESAKWLERQVKKRRRRFGYSPRELAIAERIKRLKREAGSHSPSAPTLLKQIPELRLKVDACFISNPYATDLFLEHLHREVIRPGKLRSVLEFYPSQNKIIATKLARGLGLNPDSVFIGNGAIEIIQAIIHRFTGDSLLVNLPTFSAYYEFARPDTRVIFHTARKEDNFRFDLETYLETVRREKPNTVVLINPNNPDGSYIPHAIMLQLLEELRNVPNVIVDESFIHFACEGEGYAFRSLAGYVERYPNLMIVKSMSKDFGIAGIRAGYAVMAPDRVGPLLENGYLWNTSGLAEYFFDLYSRPDFQVEYDRERIHYIRNTRRFFNALRKIEGLRVYPSQANFALVELPETGPTAEETVCRLLIRRGIYTRTCDDKRGLDNGRFIRVASRNRIENAYIVRSLKRVIS